MEEEHNDASSTLAKVGNGHWRRTYTKDGLTADLEERYQSIAIDLTDLVLVQSLSMAVEGVHPFQHEAYSESEHVTAKGHLDNATLEYIDRREGDPRGIHQLDVTLRLARAWSDEPAAKYDSKGQETAERWTPGQSQAGHLWPVSGRDLPHNRDEPYLHLTVSVPRDFLPRAREALAKPEKLGRSRLRIMLKVYEEGAQGAFSEPWDHLHFMIERDQQAMAYLTALSFDSVAVLPPYRSNVPEATASPALAATDQGPRALPYAHEIARTLKWCAGTLTAIAAILLLK